MDNSNLLLLLLSSTSYSPLSCSYSSLPFSYKTVIYIKCYETEYYTNNEYIKFKNNNNNIYYLELIDNYVNRGKIIDEYDIKIELEKKY